MTKTSSAYTLLLPDSPITVLGCATPETNLQPYHRSRPAASNRASKPAWKQENTLITDYQKKCRNSRSTTKV